MEYIELYSSCADSEASLSPEAKSEGDEPLSSDGCGSSVGIGESLSAAAAAGGRRFPESRTFSAWCTGGGGGGSGLGGLSADRIGVAAVDVVVVAAVVLEDPLLLRLAAAAAAAAAA